MKMNATNMAKTREAILGSIRKWEKIVDGSGTDEGSRNCPLCQLFLADSCNGCPVAEHTGKTGCLETPYTEYDDADEGEESKASAAARELQFLRDILEEWDARR